jgi:predicted nucleic acid-binding protein
MIKVVLDAWALLAYLQQEEPAAIRVRTVLREAESHRAELFASLINVGEVFYTIGKRKGEQAAEETLEELRRLPITIFPPEPRTIIQAARLKIRYAVSYADAFAIATAQKQNATLMTGDPEILKLKRVISLARLQRHSPRHS